jgi:hypothetical protein
MQDIVIQFNFLKSGGKGKYMSQVKQSPLKIVRILKERTHKERRFINGRPMIGQR